MAGTPVSGVGTLFRRWNGSEWENISRINSVTINKSRKTTDITSLDSTGGYNEFIGSFRDGGSVPLKMFFTRDGYDLMNEDFESDALQYYEVVLPDAEATTVEFTGLVTELGLGVTTNDAISADCSIKISGKPVINSGASSGLT
jgi:predicted secreted protein